MIYLHLDKTHEDYANIKSDCDTKHRVLWPETNLGENTKLDGLESIIKVSGADQDWIDAQSWGFSPAVIAVYEEAQHSSVLTIVQNTNWTPEVPSDY